MAEPKWRTNIDAEIDRLINMEEGEDISQSKLTGKKAALSRLFRGRISKEEARKELEAYAAELKKRIATAKKESA